MSIFLLASDILRNSASGRKREIRLVPVPTASESMHALSRECAGNAAMGPFFCRVS